MVSSFPHASVNSTCAQPPPLPGLLRGICLPWQSRGWGIKLQILRCPWARALHLLTPNSWHARSFLSDYNYTEDFTVKTSRLAHLSRTGKIEEFVKACSCFYACISSLLIKPEWHSEIESYRHEWTTFWLLNEISVDTIWRTSFHIYKTIHNS